MTGSEEKTDPEKTGDEKESSPEKSRGFSKVRAVSMKIFQGFSGFKDNLRSVVMVMLAGLAAYLVSVLLGVPFAAIVERWTVRAGDLSAVQKTIYGAMVLDFPKIAAGLIFSFAFGKFMKVRPYAAGIGIVIVIYLADLGLSYVIGSFDLVWANRYALAGRPLLGVVGCGLAAAAAVVGERFGRKKSGIRDESGESKALEKTESSEDQEEVAEPPKV